MKNEQTKLQKKLSADTFCNWIVTAGLGVIAVLKLVSFYFRLDSFMIAGKDYNGFAPGEALKDALLFALLTVTMLMMGLILKEIHKTGRPFSKKIINKLRVMSALIMVAAILPNIASEAVTFFATNSTDTDFAVLDLGVMCFGVIVGLVSEIFKYGYELQENMDSIA